MPRGPRSVSSRCTVSSVSLVPGGTAVYIRTVPRRVVHQGSLLGHGVAHGTVLDVLGQPSLGEQERHPEPVHRGNSTPSASRTALRTPSAALSQSASITAGPFGPSVLVRTPDPSFSLRSPRYPVRRCRPCLAGRPARQLLRSVLGPAAAAGRSEPSPPWSRRRSALFPPPRDAAEDLARHRRQSQLLLPRGRTRPTHVPQHPRRPPNTGLSTVMPAAPPGRRPNTRRASRHRRRCPRLRRRHRRQDPRHLRGVRTRVRRSFSMIGRRIRATHLPDSLVGRGTWSTSM